MEISTYIYLCIKISKSTMTAGISLTLQANVMEIRKSQLQKNVVGKKTFLKKFKGVHKL